MFSGYACVFFKIQSLCCRILQSGLSLQCHLACSQIFYRKHRVLICQHALFCPFKFYPRRISHNKIKAAVLFKHIGKFKLPVHKVLLTGYLFAQRKPLAFLAQGGKVYRSVFLVHIAQIVRHFFGICLILFKKAGLGIGNIDDRSFQNKRHVKQKLRPCGKQVRFFYGPEPERAPVVHGKL